MPEEHYERDFPGLMKSGYKRTSEPAYYNCIAYVVHDYHRKWWPGDYHPDWSDDYWPNTNPDESLEAFAVVLKTVEYLRCENSQLEPGFEKVALYAIGNAIQHAARQHADGTWRSKLGPDEDIEHTLDGLVGPKYGAVVAYLKRRLRGSSLSSP